MSPRVQELPAAIASETQMHSQCKSASRLLYAVSHAVSPPAAEGRRPAPSRLGVPAARRVAGVELAERVERLAYTRKQAAEALGVSLATLDRRVVPVIATVATEWGGRLIPVSELERYLAERIEPPRARRRPRARAGRKAGASARARRADPPASGRAAAASPRSPAG